jgi:serine/threonine protein kinase
VVKSARHFRIENECDVLKRFKAEAHSLRPLIDQIQDPFDPPAIVLEHLDDDVLHASAAKRLTHPEVKYVARKMLKALAVLHDDGYVHTGILSLESFLITGRSTNNVYILDIKPDNILVNYGQGNMRLADVKLADFGSTVHMDSRYATEGDFIGAPIFRSPEAHLQMRWSTTTDIWSFGTTVSY